MKKKSLFRRAAALLGAVLIAASVPASGVLAASRTTVSASKLQNGLQFNLSQMPYNGMFSPIPAVYNGRPFTVRSVQNFAFSPDNRYVFTVSEGYTGDLSEGIKHTILCCCAVPSKKGAGQKAVCQDAVILDKFGHGETIAVTKSSAGSNAYDIWVACKPNSVKTQRYGTRIARLTYKIGAQGKGRITKMVSVRDFTSDGRRLNYDRVGVAINSSANRIAFRVHGANGSTGTYYEIYDFKKLNSALNKVKDNGTYDISKAKSMLRADVKYSSTPFDTFQSFDIDSRYIYICGGHMDKGAQIHKVSYRTDPIGKASFQYLTSTSQEISIVPKITVEGNTLGVSDLEIEGMKIQSKGKKTIYYVNFFMNETPIGENIGIYKFTA